MNELNPAEAFKQRLEEAILRTKPLLEEAGKSLEDKDMKDLVSQLESRPKTTMHNYGSYLSILNDPKTAAMLALMLYVNGGNYQGIYWALRVNGLTA